MEQEKDDTYRFTGSKVKVKLKYFATICCNVIAQKGF